ncbi:MAG: Sapep family Mn(2+)-dependent dipeptidase, partial [Clostridia bacterium]|nr:Sapep family Mn(2+)-dependent dipeptidase [Clostridia bacterium]
MKNWLKDHRNAMLEDCIALCSISSTEDQPCPEQNAPFGLGVRKALDCAFDIARRLGMSTLDCDGYCGHAEIGEGDGEPFYILTHLDVVPPGEGWKTPPFEPTIRDGKLYARGVIDNKAPTIAVLYAAAAAAATGELKRPVRIVFGCDEETTWEGLARYPHKMGEGFAPDASFPLIYAEKGVLWLEISWEGLPDPAITSFQGGERPNMVPAHAEAVSGNETLTEKGISAHGSRPELGVNAARQLAEKLRPQKDTAAAVLCEILSKADLDGKGLNIKCADEPSGPLTVNAGKAFLQGGYAVVTLDIRYPVTANLSVLLTKL